MNEEWKQQTGQIAISRQLLDQASAMSDAYEKLLVFDFTASPEERAAKAAERKARYEAEWDAHPGMVGLQDHSDPECGPDYQLAERGDYVTLWTTPEKWGMYLFARHLLDVCEEGLSE